MFKLINKYFIFLIILLLASPALSIFGILGYGYFPNEKIALALTVLSIYSWNKDYRQLRLIGIGCSAILLFLFLAQIITGSNGQIRASLNSILIIASIPLYYSLLSARPDITMRLIFYTGVIQFLISLIQQYYSLTFNYELANMFNNYPAQENYIYPIGETGVWYRTSGLFFESSSYGVFQWLSIICALKINFHKKFIGKIILCLMILEVILNGALTGYLFAIGFFLSSILIQFKSRIKFKNLIISFLSTVALFFILQVSGYYDISGIFTKLTGQFNFLYDDYNYQPSRLKGMLESIENSISSDNVMFGSGFSWTNPTLDFYSLYLKAYGITGLLSLMFFIFILIRNAPVNYKVAVIFALSVNGHLSTVINIIILSVPLIFYSSNKYIHRSIE